MTNVFEDTCFRLMSWGNSFKMKIKLQVARYDDIRLQMYGSFKCIEISLKILRVSFSF